MLRDYASHKEDNGDITGVNFIV